LGVLKIARIASNEKGKGDVVKTNQIYFDKYSQMTVEVNYKYKDIPFLEFSNI